MTKLLVAASVLGLSLSTAGACEFMRSAKAKVDNTVVASIAEERTDQMSTPVILPPQEPVAVEEDTE